MVPMEMTRTPEGLVTPLAVVRSIRDLTHQTVGHRVGVKAEQVLAWERGEPIPAGAMAKRLGLALGWEWQDLLGPHLPTEEAWSTLVHARQKIAECR